LINGFSFGEFHFNDMLINSSNVRQPKIKILK
jgi:hypothetical protein